MRETNYFTKINQFRALTQTAIQEQIQQQINALKAATKKAVRSRKTAIKYLADAGLLRDKEDSEEKQKEKDEAQSNRYIATASTFSNNRDHSCDRSIGLAALNGNISLTSSNNPWDWLGDGIYF